MKKHKVGIIGSGTVGHALAKGFASRGCEVKIGSRSKKDDLVTFAEAATFGEIVILATRWDGTENAIQLAGPASFAGKVLIDATNPLLYPPGQSHAAGLAFGFSDSGGEQVQRWLPEARVVKAWNTVGASLMCDPKLPDGPPTMFIGGNDEGAKREVTDIMTEFGWDTIDVGGIEAARLLEPMCWLWVTIGMRTGNWTQAFKMLRG
jgi:predicted dinucleotide-binding enzyme